MSTMTTIASLVLLAMFVIFGVQYGVMSIGSTDQGVNMTGSPYEDQYDASTNATIATISLVNHTSMLIGIMILVVSVAGLIFTMKRRR